MASWMGFWPRGEIGRHSMDGLSRPVICTLVFVLQPHLFSLALLQRLSIQRETTFADLVHLVNFHNDAGGLAFLFNPTNPTSDAYAFGVTSSTNLFALTFAHELGHNAVRVYAGFL